MDALQFLNEYGKAEAEQVCKRARTSYAYFSQIAYGHRRPSPDMAERLEEASDKRLNFEALLRKKTALSSTQPTQETAA